MAPRSACRSADGSAPFVAATSLSRARMRASSGVSVPTFPRARRRVRPSAVRYWTMYASGAARLHPNAEALQGTVAAVPQEHVLAIGIGPDGVDDTLAELWHCSGSPFSGPRPVSSAARMFSPASPDRKSVPGKQGGSSREAIRGTSRNDPSRTTPRRTALCQPLGMTGNHREVCGIRPS